MPINLRKQVTPKTKKSPKLIGLFLPFSKVNFLILVYFQIPLIIDFTPKPLISSKYITKVYIQKLINKKIRT
ncbi:hypothetical protein COL87_30290 [Bacillus pseudomycoides]|nr:hypothetical protein COL87_30290 [Bacillus pseudomycoides]PHE05791.1 hypothetical protein COF59_25530 [Bacillus pseudomycoides]PHE94637.1 hypothetical protein COF78_13060 [Bacillus pseudomycoides]